MRQRDGMDEIRVSAPVPGTCPVCATKHDARDPHNRDSLYYQQRFYRQNRRFPTWEDAMAHCSVITKLAFRDQMLKRGIVIRIPEEAEKP